MLLVFLVLAPLAAEEPGPAWTRLQDALRDQHLQLDPGDERISRVEALGRSLTGLQKRHPLVWRFVVVDSARANAGCTGEGVVYVTKGLLDLGLDDNELAGIIGHEVAHGLLRHVEANQWSEERARRTRQDQKLALERVALLEEARNSHSIDEAEFERQKQELYQQAVALKARIDSIRAEARNAPNVLRRQESEADAVGLQLARIAGYQEDGLLRALRKLQTAHSDEENQLAYRHPSLQQRIESLERLLKVLDILVPIPKNAP